MTGLDRRVTGGNGGLVGVRRRSSRCSCRQPCRRWTRHPTSRSARHSRRNHHRYHPHSRRCGPRIHLPLPYKLNRFLCACAGYRWHLSTCHRYRCDRRSHRSTRRSRSRFSSVGAGHQNTCSMSLWNRNANRSPWCCIRRCGRMPFGYVDWKKNCSMIRSSCCGWRIRNPNRRSSGNRLRAGAAM